MKKRRVQAAEDLLRETAGYILAMDEAAHGRAVARLMRFEARSLQAHTRAWTSLIEFMTRKKVAFGDHDLPAAMGGFLDGHKGATQPASMWNKLGFMWRHVGVSIHLQPKPQRRTQGGVATAPQGGVVIEPELLLRLERYTPKLQSTQGWRLGALLAAPYIARSAVRYAHMQGSVLTARTGTVVHATCYRGKTKKSRAQTAFRHSAPRMALDPVTPSPIDALWNLWSTWRQKLGDKLSYLCLNAEHGAFMPMSMFHTVIRELVIEAGRGCACCNPQWPTSGRRHGKTGSPSETGPKCQGRAV